MNYIYLVNEEASYDGNFTTWATYKAFKNKEKAVEYAKHLMEYNSRNKVEGVKREVFIKEVELGE